MSFTAGRERQEKTDVIEKYFDCVISGRIDELPVTDDYGSESPSSGLVQGPEAVAYLGRIGAEMSAIRVVQHVVEGNFVATHFEEDIDGGTVPVFALFELAGEKVRFVRVFFDRGAPGA